MNVMLYEQVKNLYFNYMQIQPIHNFIDFVSVRGEINVTTRKDSRNNRET